MTLPGGTPVYVLGVTEEREHPGHFELVRIGDDGLRCLIDPSFVVPSSRIDALERVIAGEPGWSLTDVLERLVDAVTHSLTDHDCDRHGYELDKRAADAARRLLARLEEAKGTRGT